MKNMKKLSFCLAQLILFVGIVGIFALPVLAQTSSTSDVFVAAYDTLFGTFKRARAVVYVMGGFALAGVATAAIFGKLNVRWLAMVGVALLVLGLSEKIVAWAVEAGRGRVPNSSFTVAGQTVTVSGSGADVIPGYTYESIYQAEDSDFRQKVINQINQNSNQTSNQGSMSYQDYENMMNDAFPYRQAVLNATQNGSTTNSDNNSNKKVGPYVENLNKTDSEKLKEAVDAVDAQKKPETKPYIIPVK